MTHHTPTITAETAVERRCDFLRAQIAEREARLAGMNTRTITYHTLVALNASDNRQVFELMSAEKKHG